MAETMIDPGVDLAAHLREQHRHRRAKFASAKEPAPKIARVPVANGVVHLIPREKLAKMALNRLAEKYITIGYFSADRALLDYMAKDRLYDEWIGSDGQRVEATGKIFGLRVRTIVEHVARARNIDPKDVLGVRRFKPIVEARQEVAWLACRHCTHSLPHIGRQLGGKDHTTVMHGRDVFAKRLESGEAKRSGFFNYDGKWFRYAL